MIGQQQYQSGYAQYDSYNHAEDIVDSDYIRSQRDVLNAMDNTDEEKVVDYSDTEQKHIEKVLQL